MNKKTSNKAKLLEYLNDPENDFLTRTELSLTVLGYKHQRTIYRHFTPHELSEIESSAIIERKARSARQRANIYSALYNRAVGYSHPDVNILSNRVRTTDKEGKITEKTEPLIVNITKHYPPETQAAREYLDRIEGKVPDAKKEAAKEDFSSWEEVGKIFTEAASKIATKLPDDIESE